MFRFRSTRAGLRAIAVFEAAKGALVLAAGFGLIAWLHRGMQLPVEDLARHLHLNPGGRLSRIFIYVIGSADAHLTLIAVLALAYITFRMIEAYGLWYERKWGESLGIISGGMYLPLEIYELTKSVSGIKICVFTLNLFIVVWLLRVRFGRGSGDAGGTP